MIAIIRRENKARRLTCHVPTRYMRGGGAYSINPGGCYGFAYYIIEQSEKKKKIFFFFFFLQESGVDFRVSITCSKLPFF